jgi:hypothetical protein
MGLGPLALYGLQEARAEALEARRLRHEGIDPKIASAITRRLVANKVFDFSHDLHTRWIPFRVEGAGSIHRGDKSRIGPHLHANRPVSTGRSIIRGIWIVRLAHFICNHFDIVAARPSSDTRYAEAENKPGDR